MRSNQWAAAARDAKAARLAAAVHAAVPGLTPAEVGGVLFGSDPESARRAAAVRRAAEAFAGTRPASEQTWGLAAGKLRQQLAER
jgi:hypothetical protein